MKEKCLYDELAKEPGWKELHAMLVSRYQEAKERKMSPGDKYWSLWSGTFNGYCRSFHDENEQDTPYTHLFGMWGTMTRMLEIKHQLRIAKGEVKRGKLRKLVSSNKHIYAVQKKRFFYEIKAGKQI